MTKMDITDEMFVAFAKNAIRHIEAFMKLSKKYPEFGRLTIHAKDKEGDCDIMCSDDKQYWISIRDSRCIVSRYEGNIVTALYTQKNDSATDQSTQSQTGNQ